MSRTIRDALQSIFEITQEAWHVRGNDVRLTEIRGIARGALAEPAEPAELASMQAEIKALRALVREMNDHEGAEGWSEHMRPAIRAAIMDQPQPTLEKGTLT